MVIYISNLQKPEGTELGINVDLKSTNVKNLDFTKGEGYLEVVSEELIKSDSTFN